MGRPKGKAAGTKKAGRPPRLPRPAEQFANEVRQLTIRVRSLQKIRDVMALKSIPTVAVSVDLESTLNELKRLIDEAVESVNENLPKRDRLDPIEIYHLNGDE